MNKEDIIKQLEQIEGDLSSLEWNLHHASEMIEDLKKELTEPENLIMVDTHDR